MIPAFVNPAAGNASDVDKALTRAGCFDIRAVAPDQVTQAVEAEVIAGTKRVAVAGGDGTISAAAAALARTKTELVVIPAGTFNHFARDYRIPTDLHAACALATSGRAISADVAYVNGRMFLNTSSVGVYANFVRRRERWEPTLGYWMASVWSALRSFARVQPFRLWFGTAGIERYYDTPLVFIGIGERELKLPRLGARIEGGGPGIHVMIVRGRTRARLVALAFAAAAKGTWATSGTPHLDSFLVARCRIEQRHSTVAVDGEIVQLASPLEYEYVAGALRLVVPEDSAATTI